MGGRRLPLAQTLSPAILLCAILSAALSGACIFGGDDDDDPTPTATAGNTSPTATLPPSPTPDPVSTPPVSQLDARRWLQAVLGPSGFEPPCPQRLSGVGVGCAQGDGNGDGAIDLAYLVPVSISGTQLPKPSAVIVRDGKSDELQEFAIDLTADSSIFGLAFFTFEDRNGDRRADLSYLQNACGIAGCRTRPVVKSWDGTAWRDIGPAEEGISSIDLAAWEGSGAASTLVVHGGQLPESARAEAGPTRDATTTYTLQGARFAAGSVEPDEPEYLYHAFLDADAVFEDDWQRSLPLFEAVIADTELKDWAARPGQDDRRAALRGLALFRIALVQAALQREPSVLNAALDRVILESDEQLFVNVATQFRKGYNERGGVIGGCAEVNLYLSRPIEGTDTRGYVIQLFNYGYANPPGSDWLQRICPF